MASPSLTDLLASAKTGLEALLQESPDRCSVYNRTYATDSAGGSTATDTAVATNIPVIYSNRVYSDNRVAGGSLAETTHNLYLINTAATAGIKPNYVIVVSPRNNLPALTFQNPIRLDESLSPLIHIAAQLKP